MLQQLPLLLSGAILQQILSIFAYVHLLGLDGVRGAIHLGAELVVSGHLALDKVPRPDLVEGDAVDRSASCSSTRSSLRYGFLHRLSLAREQE